MKDNIGNEISIGDLVLCYSGQYKYTIQKVKGFRICNGESLNCVTDAINFEGRGWLSALNVVSLNALGADVSSIQGYKLSGTYDAIGNTVHVGDKVLYLHAKELYAQIGIVKSMKEKSCLLTIEENRFGQKEYRKKYNELISLSAIGALSTPTRNWRGDIIE